MTRRIMVRRRCRPPQSKLQDSNGCPPVDGRGRPGDDSGAAHAHGLGGDLRVHRRAAHAQRSLGAGLPDASRARRTTISTGHSRSPSPSFRTARRPCAAHLRVLVGSSSVPGDRERPRFRSCLGCTASIDSPDAVPPQRFAAGSNHHPVHAATPRITHHGVLFRDTCVPKGPRSRVSRR